MVVREPLKLFVGVRFPYPQPNNEGQPPKYRGLFIVNIKDIVGK